MQCGATQVRCAVAAVRRLQVLGGQVTGAQGKHRHDRKQEEHDAFQFHESFTWAEGRPLFILSSLGDPLRLGVRGLSRAGEKRLYARIRAHPGAIQKNRARRCLRCSIGRRELVPNRHYDLAFFVEQQRDAIRIRVKGAKPV